MLRIIINSFVLLVTSPNTSYITYKFIALIHYSISNDEKKVAALVIWQQKFKNFK